MIGNFPCPLAPLPSRPLSLHLLSSVPTPLALEASSQSCLSCWMVFCSWRFCCSNPRPRSASTFSCFSNSRSRWCPATSWLCCSSLSSLSSRWVWRSSWKGRGTVTGHRGGLGYQTMQQLELSCFAGGMKDVVATWARGLIASQKVNHRMTI